MGLHKGNQLLEEARSLNKIRNLDPSSLYRSQEPRESSASGLLGFKETEQNPPGNCFPVEMNGWECVCSLGRALPHFWIFEIHFHDLFPSCLQSQLTLGPTPDHIWLHWQALALQSFENACEFSSTASTPLWNYLPSSLDLRVQCNRGDRHHWLQNRTKDLAQNCSSNVQEQGSESSWTLERLTVSGSALSRHIYVCFRELTGHTFVS